MGLDVPSRTNYKFPTCTNAETLCATFEEVSITVKTIQLVLIASKDSSFVFWQKWLFYTSLLFAIAGISFALLGNNFLFQPYNIMLAKLFWHSSKFPSEADQFRTFIYGPLGATIACCYILLAFIARFPFKNKERWARNAIIFAFSVWVLIDSAVCFYFGVYPQVYFINAFSITIKALPIIFTWKHFSMRDKFSKFTS